MKPKQVWILDEGSHGHLVQSRGLILELAKTANLETTEIPVRCRLPRRFARSLAKRLLRACPTRTMFRLLYPEFATPATQPDLIVSSGPHSLAPLEFLSKHHGCPSVFVQGSIRIPKGAVTAIMRPFEGEHREDYIFIPLLFTEITPESVARAKEEFLTKKPLQLRQPVNALFIGNSSAKISFSQDDWSNIARFVNDLSRLDGSRWLITTSSRTGRELEQLFQRIIEPDAIAHAVWYGQSPDKVTKAFLGLADRVFVTMDSLTMVTEAVASGRPVHAFCPGHLPDWRANTHLQYIRNLADNGMISLVTAESGQDLTLPPTDRPEADYSHAIRQLLDRLQWTP